MDERNPSCWEILDWIEEYIEFPRETGNIPPSPPPPPPPLILGEPHPVTVRDGCSTIDGTIHPKNKDTEDPQCSNCGTWRTPAWRRSPSTGDLVCNACGLYEKVNKCRRHVWILPNGVHKTIRKGYPRHRPGYSLCKMTRCHP